MLRSGHALRHLIKLQEYRPQLFILSPVERIIQIISDIVHPVDLDRLLVVTFTNAAAAEMKERIGAAIQKQLLENLLTACKLSYTARSYRDIALMNLLAQLGNDLLRVLQQ